MVQASTGSDEAVKADFNKWLRQHQVDLPDMIAEKFSAAQAGPDPASLEACCMAVLERLRDEHRQPQLLAMSDAQLTAFAKKQAESRRSTINKRRLVCQRQIGLHSYLHAIFIPMSGSCCTSPKALGFGVTVNMLGHHVCCTELIHCRPLSSCIHTCCCWLHLHCICAAASCLVCSTVAQCLCMAILMLLTTWPCGVPDDVLSCRRMIAATSQNGPKTKASTWCSCWLT